MFRRITALLISSVFILQQAGFAQVAVQMPVPAYLNHSLNSFECSKPVQIRSIEYRASDNHISLIVDKGDAKIIPQQELQNVSRELLNYFKIGLALPDSAFWVNLRPDSPAQIIDPYLERTELGKVLLAADLQLKKDMAFCTSPDTAEGRVYWNKLYTKAEQLFGVDEDIDIPTAVRPWIVPGEILIGQNRSSAYVYKATLNVMLEQDYIKDSAFSFSADPRAQQLNEYSGELIRTLILPKLIQRVNASKQYAGLRQVYYSLILAQWFKARYGAEISGAEKGSLVSTINSMDLSGLTSKSAWQKQSYFNAYRDSVQNGEYNKEEKVRTGSGITIRKYVSGGVVPLVTKGQVSVINNVAPLGAGLAVVDVTGNDVEVADALFQPGSVARNDGGIKLGLISPDQQAAFSDLLEIYGHNTVALEADLKAEAANLGKEPVDILVGSFGPEARQNRQQLGIGTSMTNKAPPAAKTDIVILSGGAASRLLIPAIQKLGRGFAWINSLLTNVDDGGATRKIIDLLKKNGYGITPPVGDQMNALLNSFLGLDKVFTLLDDSGRVKDRYLGFTKNELLNNVKTFKQLIIEGLKQVRERDELYIKAAEAMQKDDFSTAEQALTNLLSALKNRLNISKELEIRYENGDALLKKAQNKIILSAQEKAALQAQVNSLRSKDFLSFSVNLIRLADIIDNELPGLDGKPMFTMAVLLDQGQSIRNLLLVAAWADQGILSNDPAKSPAANAFTPTIMPMYQESMNRLAQAVGITGGTVSLSSAKPTVVYAQYEDNVLAWLADINGKPTQTRVKFHIENGQLLISEDGKSRATIGPSAAPWTLQTGSVTFEAGVKSGQAYFKLNGDEWSVRENDNGDQTYLEHEGQVYLVNSDGPSSYFDNTGNQVYFSMGGMSSDEVLFVPRFITTQTHVTETVNFSKIVEFGFAEDSPVSTSGVFRTTMPQAKRVNNQIVVNRISSVDTNQAAIDMIDNAQRDIVAGPGSFYTSILAHLMCEGIVDALIRAKKRGLHIIFVMNVNEDNETKGMSFQDMIDAVEHASNKKFNELFTHVVIGTKIDYIEFLNAAQDPLAAQGDYRTDIKPRVTAALQQLVNNNATGMIQASQLRVTQSVLDKFMADPANKIIVPPGIQDKYSWVLKNHPGAIDTLAENIETSVGLLYGEALLEVYKAGAVSKYAKVSRGLISDVSALHKLSGVRVMEESMYGITASINRATGVSKPSMGYLKPLLSDVLNRALRDGGITPETPDATTEGKQDPSASQEFGGIDLRYLPVGNQQLLQTLSANLPVVLANASASELASRWQNIQQRMTSQNVSFKEIRDCIVAISSRSDCSQLETEVATYIAGILEMEEAANIPTALELKEAVSCLVG